LRIRYFLPLIMAHIPNGVKNTFLFTSESVGEGHPDKMA
jgi:hypothetical protein